MSLLIWVAMEEALQEAGCDPSPWHPEFKAVLHITTKTWTSSVMTFMSDNGIDFHHNIRLDGYSHKDSFIMATFIKQGASSP
jgi:hypothetical protein